MFLGLHPFNILPKLHGTKRKKKATLNMQIYLIVPPQPDAKTRTTSLALAETGHVAAMLVQRGTLGEAEYKDWAKSLIKPAQKNDVAVLLDNLPEAVAPLKADGVHLTQSAKDTGHWAKKLKPESILGAGEVFSRHDAMTKGEKDIDYVFFGQLAADKNNSEHESAEMANWWAETFEVPAVGFVEDVTLLTKQVEFCAVRELVFEADDPVAALNEIVAQVQS
ncbi:thiamine phosphate synthase [Maritalea mediterranea]|uniref:Thiamine phosphate synthase n=1 Tax=Maritalea mediterranea TaxID=2909667 RepID=A0ABS9EBX1_9HYPH|nr:thiamine phosphate synthase [Maritalea mediterranea]MCF4099654.1 thiamine phosphate synthase [Maritalea mediterranea]